MREPSARRAALGTLAACRGRDETLRALDAFLRVAASARRATAELLLDAGERDAGRADEAARRAGSSPAHPPPACRHSESAARPRRRRSSTGAAPSAGEANAPSRVTRGRAGGRSCVVAPGADPAILELLDNSQLSCHTSSDA